MIFITANYMDFKIGFITLNQIDMVNTFKDAHTVAYMKLLLIKIYISIWVYNTCYSSL